MTWTAPRTWVTGEVVTAAMMNVDVKQNIGHLGGMLRNGVALSAMSSPSELLGNFGAKAHHSTTQSIANSTWTNVLFDTEGANGWDSGTIHSVASNTQNFTVPATGMYLCCCQVYWAANATGFRAIRITQNGTQISEQYAINLSATAFTIAFFSSATPVNALRSGTTPTPKT